MINKEELNNLKRKYAWKFSQFTVKATYIAVFPFIVAHEYYKKVHKWKGK